MSQPQNPESLSEQPLVAHLLELRDRLLKSFLAIGLLFLPMIPFAQEIYTVFAAPLLSHIPQGSAMIAIDVTSPFFTPFKLILVLAFFLAAPFTLYQIWAFVAPGLYAHEKRMIIPLLVSSTLLFYAGAAFAFYVVLPLVFGFLTAVAPEGVAVTPDISRYLDFVLTLFFAFGIAFEVPIITIVSVWGGLTTPDALRKKRPYVIVAAFVIGMLLTPPDVISQTLLAVPMWLLFELGVIFSQYYVREPDNAIHNGSAYVAPTDAEMEAELDASEAEFERESIPIPAQTATEKLALAKQFIAQQDYLNARVMLHEVVVQGDANERALAQALLNTLQ